MRQRRSWLGRALFYLLFPLIVWFAAFLVWFYWYDLTRLVARDQGKPKATVKIESKEDKRDKAEAPSKRVQEKILDEDRRKLDEILKQRQ